MSQVPTNVSPETDNYLFSYNKAHAEKEVLQQKHYFLLGELQNMAKELPPKFQQRLPNELLSDIAKSLLDGTVYEIVNNLKEIQIMTEKNLFSQRLKAINAQKLEKQEFEKKCKEIPSSKVQSGNPEQLIQQQLAMKQQIEALKKKHQEEVTRMDMKLIMELDQKVSEQQVTLVKANVPGFSVTNNSTEIKLQMHILDFIQRLSIVQFPS